MGEGDRIVCLIGLIPRCEARMELGDYGRLRWTKGRILWEFLGSARPYHKTKGTAKKRWTSVCNRTWLYR